MNTTSPGLVRLPLVMILALGAFVALPRVHDNPHMAWAFGGTASALLVWFAVLAIAAKRGVRTLAVHWAPPVK